jgi:hypothetical protein
MMGTGVYNHNGGRIVRLPKADGNKCVAVKLQLVNEKLKTKVGELKKRGAKEVETYRHRNRLFMLGNFIGGSGELNSNVSSRCPLTAKSGKRVMAHQELGLERGRQCARSR